MEWRKHWYGENPSLLHKCVTNGLVLVSLLCFYAVWVDFVPSELWWRWGSVTAALLSLVVAAVLHRGFQTGQLWRAPDVNGWKRRVVAVLAPVLLFGMFWLPIVRVLPDTAARVFGQYTEVTTSLRAVYSYRSRLCDYRLEGELLSRAFPVDYICISTSDYDALRNSGPVTLRGRQTPLGMHIDQVLMPIPADSDLQAPRETRAPEG
jgi:hypothetical protein